MKTIPLNFTKLFTALFIVSLGLFSCNKDLTINFDTNLVNIKSIHIDKTAGTAVAFSDSSTIVLENEDTEPYLDRIEAIESINSFTYQFQDFTGDAAGTVSFDILVNGTVIEHKDNIVIKDESDNATLFQISNEDQLNEIADGLLDNQAVTFKFSGTALCDAAPMDFDMEIKMDITLSASPL